MILEDVQNRPDTRGIALDAVGISQLRYPAAVAAREYGKQETVAGFALTVDLPSSVKGTHLSRFVHLVHEYAADLSIASLSQMAQDLKERLSSGLARIEAEFPYFVERAAPVTGARAMLECQGRLAAEARGDAVRPMIGVTVPVTSVCPCSKSISDYGAHNQRGHIRIDAWLSADADQASIPLSLDELIEMAEGCGSSPVYPLLKRADERHVTMAAHDNPVFVEDMARSVIHALRDDSRIATFTVEVTNDESIHNHAAFARATWPVRSADGPAR
jgi:GTP cyclohydrolase I